MTSGLVPRATAAAGATGASMCRGASSGRGGPPRVGVSGDDPTAAGLRHEYPPGRLAGPGRRPGRAPRRARRDEASGARGATSTCWSSFAGPRSAGFATRSPVRSRSARPRTNGQGPASSTPRAEALRIAVERSKRRSRLCRLRRTRWPTASGPSPACRGTRMIFICVAICGVSRGARRIGRWTASRTVASTRLSSRVSTRSVPPCCRAKRFERCASCSPSRHFFRHAYAAEWDARQLMTLRHARDRRPLSCRAGGADWWLTSRAQHAAIRNGSLYQSVATP